VLTYAAFYKRNSLWLELVGKIGLSDWQLHSGAVVLADNKNQNCIPREVISKINFGTLTTIPV
jgi:hypothetical protein